MGYTENRAYTQKTKGPWRRLSRRGKRTVVFGKIFQSIYDSVLVDDPIARLIFMDLIVLSDREGVVEMAPPRLAKKIGLDLEVVEEKLELLSQPDKYSKSQEAEGRRIVKLDNNRWGYRVVNKEMYAVRSTPEKRRAQARERKAAQRKRNQNPGMDFPCDSGTGSIRIYEKKIKEWEQNYPDMDVRQELRVARQHLQDKEDLLPPSGMHVWLSKWLKRAIKGSYVKRDEPLTIEPTRDDVDPHNPDRHGFRLPDGQIWCSHTGGPIAAEEWKEYDDGEPS